MTTSPILPAADVAAPLCRVEQIPIASVAGLSSESRMAVLLARLADADAVTRCLLDEYARLRPPA